jgi:hypothetical protein
VALARNFARISQLTCNRRALISSFLGEGIRRAPNAPEQPSYETDKNSSHFDGGVF